MEGKSLEEIVRITNQVALRVDLVGVLDTIRYVYRTGRILKIAARFGSMLKIKPIFTISGGLIQMIGVTKDQGNGMRRILKQMREKVGTQPVHVALAQAEALEVGKKMQEKIRSEFNCSELWLTDFSAVMAYATGEGVLVAAFYTQA
jgi:DegV family protein with EDD domain